MSQTAIKLRNAISSHYSQNKQLDLLIGEAADEIEQLAAFVIEVGGFWNHSKSKLVGEDSLASVINQAFKETAPAEQVSTEPVAYAVYFINGMGKVVIDAIKPYAGPDDLSDTNNLADYWAGNVFLYAATPQVSKDEPADSSYPFYELRFIMRVLGHEGAAPKADWQTAYGMAREIFTRWHAVSKDEPVAGDWVAQALRCVPEKDVSLNTDSHCQEYSDGWADGHIAGWNECREAMLSSIGAPAPLVADASEPSSYPPLPWGIYDQELAHEVYTEKQMREYVDAARLKSPQPEPLTDAETQEIFRQNSQGYNGNYEITPGQALQIAIALSKASSKELK